MGIKENLAKFQETKRVESDIDNRSRKDRIEDRVTRVLARNGHRKPKICDYEGERELYFKHLQSYNKKVGFLLNEVMNKKKTI